MKLFILFFLIAAHPGFAWASLEDLFFKSSLEREEYYERKAIHLSLRRRCFAELEQKRLLLPCFDLFRLEDPKSASTVSLLIRQCEANAKEMSSLADHLAAFTSKKVPDACKNVIQERMAVLIYKMEDFDPALALFYMEQIKKKGPQIEKQGGKRKTSSNEMEEAAQSN